MIEPDATNHPTAHRATFPWARVFILIASIVGMALVFATPILSGTDEVAHVARVALISQGKVVPDTSPSPPSTHVGRDCLATLVQNYRFRVLGKEPPGSWRDQFRSADCQEGADILRGAAVTANFYNPVPYAPAIVGFRIGRAIDGAPGSIYGARLAQLAAYIGVIALALSRLPRGHTVLFTVALLPVSLQGAANVSADPMTLATICLLVSLVLEFTERARAGKPCRTRDWVLLGATVSAVALCKSAYLPFALLVLVIPTAAFGTLRRRLRVTAPMLAVAGCLAVAWNFGVAARISIVGVNHSDSTAAARWVRQDPAGFLAAIVRGWRVRPERVAILTGFVTPVRRFAQNFPAPAWLGIIWLAAARIADPVPELLRSTLRRISGGHTDPIAPERPLSPTRADRRIAVGIAATVAATTILLIEYGIAIAANPPGAHEIIWVQGRYFLPLVPLTLFGISGRTRAISDRWLVGAPIMSSVVLVAWFWWAWFNLWAWG